MIDRSCGYSLVASIDLSACARTFIAPTPRGAPTPVARRVPHGTTSSMRRALPPCLCRTTQPCCAVRQQCGRTLPGPRQLRSVVTQVGILRRSSSELRRSPACRSLSREMGVWIRCSRGLTRPRHRLPSDPRHRPHLVGDRCAQANGFRPEVGSGRQLMWPTQCSSRSHNLAAGCWAWSALRT
jgi:hypothetical protein